MSYPLCRRHICSVCFSPFPFLCPWMQTGNDGTTLLSLFPYGRRGKERWEAHGHIWRILVLDWLIRLRTPILASPPAFPPHPPEILPPWLAGCRWDTLGSTSSSAPTQMAAGIPLGKASRVQWC